MYNLAKNSTEFLAKSSDLEFWDIILRYNMKVFDINNIYHDFIFLIGIPEISSLKSSGLL